MFTIQKHTWLMALLLGTVAAVTLIAPRTSCPRNRQGCGCCFGETLRVEPPCQGTPDKS